MHIHKRSHLNRDLQQIEPLLLLERKMHVHMYVHMNVYMYVHMCVYMNAYVYDVYV